MSLVGIRVKAGVKAVRGPVLGCDNIGVLWASVFLRGRFYRGMMSMFIRDTSHFRPQFS